MSTGIHTLCDARHLTPGDERKIAAYDAARAAVKIEGNTRAYYVLRAENAEAEAERLRDALLSIDSLVDYRLEWGWAAAIHGVISDVLGTAPEPAP